jgi:putative endonuclease
MEYLYILYSTTSDKYYVGTTTDVDRRLFEHNHAEGSFYTSKHRPWVLKAVFECKGSKEQVLKAEHFIKRQKSRFFVERLIQGEQLYGILGCLTKIDK